MNTSLTPSALLLGLGQKIGIEGLTFSSSGLCELVFDGNLRTVTAVDRNTLFSAVQLEARPLPLGSPLVERALRANFMWQATHGATIALDSERRLWAQRTPDLAGDVASLLANLELLLDLADSWRLNEEKSFSPAPRSEAANLFANRV